MFDSLEETMKHDEQEATSPKERWMRNAAIAAVSLVVFGGLYFGIQMLG